MADSHVPRGHRDRPGPGARGDAPRPRRVGYCRLPRT